MAAGNTYEAIATQTLGSAAASVTFSSIPATYTDLVLVVNGFAGADYYTVRFNSDAGTNYSRTLLYTSGSSAVSTRNSNDNQIYGSIGDSSSNIGGTIHHIQNYSNTTTYKTTIRRGGAASAFQPQLGVGLWRNTAAISTILLTAGSGNFGTGSTFNLYGIKAA